MGLSEYRPSCTSVWRSRVDNEPGRRISDIVHCFDLAEVITNTGSQSIALLGFCSDEGIRRNQGRVGAKSGPLALRAALRHLTIPSTWTLKIIDCGDIAYTEGDLEQGQIALVKAVTTLRQKNYFPIVLGGGHEAAWAHFQGLAKTSQLCPGIINFDAHFDLRALIAEQQGTSGTSFLQIANWCKTNYHAFQYTCLGIQPTANLDSLFEKANKLKVAYLLASEMHTQPLNATQKFVKRQISKLDSIYLTICLDVFAAYEAPGVSAPQVSGLTQFQVLPLIQQIILSKKVIGLDVVELNPQYDIDNRTAKLGARIIYEAMLHLNSLQH